MSPIQFQTIGSLAEAEAVRPPASFIAGGTNVVDLLKLEVLKPGTLVSITPLPLRGIDEKGDGLRIGALETMSAVAAHPLVASGYPVIAQALLQSASAQLRNMASMGGNLLQRTRCGYFRDVNSGCNKRVPGTGCPAIHGANRMLAILGTSPHCIATNPSDLAVALVALDAAVAVRGQDGSRSIRLREFYLEPGDTPDRENQLRPGELITEIRVPRLAPNTRSAYVKVRDRASYEFALSSAAVALTMDGDRVQKAEVAAGGVGTKPWWLPRVGDALVGKTLSLDTVEAAARLSSENSQRYSDNGFKVEMLQRTLVRALCVTGGIA
ncbi:MAG TPA: FAD binding domain-containing protein [Chthoniobacterales bacterium]